MKKMPGTILIFFFFSILARLYAINLPLYPFELSYSIYPGEHTGEVENLVHVNAGVRIETFKEAYFDCFFLGDLLFKIDKNVAKEKKVKVNMLEKDVIDFLAASINFPSILGKRLSLSLFFGKYDTLGSESILREHIKTQAASSVFMQSYPMNLLRPNLEVKGAGVAIYGAFLNGIYSGFYTHWNTKTNENFLYTNDFRLGFTYSTFVFESFMGFLATKSAKDFRLRLGSMGSVTIEDYEFFFELGLAKLQIKGINFTSLNSQFYVLFEPRIKKEKYNIALSFFILSPSEIEKGMHLQDFSKRRFLGFNVLAGLGNLELHKVSGGLSVLTAIDLQNIAQITPFTLSIAPFLTAIVKEELEFNFRLPINPLMYNNLREAVRGEISVKAVY